MLFSSLVFLFCFLPFAVFGYYLIRHELRNLFLLLVSLFFYGWGGIRYLVVMLGVIVINYLGGIASGKFGHKKTVLCYMSYCQEFNRLIISFAGISIFEKANQRLPKSLMEAPI